MKSSKTTITLRKPSTHMAKIVNQLKQRRITLAQIYADFSRAISSTRTSFRMMTLNKTSISTLRILRARLSLNLMVAADMLRVQLQNKSEQSLLKPKLRMAKMLLLPNQQPLSLRPNPIQFPLPQSNLL